MNEIRSTNISQEMWGSYEFIQLFDAFRFALKSSKSLNVDDPTSMTNNDYLNLTGLSKGNSH